MVDSVFDDLGDDIPPEDIHGPLWQFMADWYTGSDTLEDQTYLAALLGVTLEELPAFLENESATGEQLQAMYAYKELLDNNPDWNDLTNEEKNALLEESGLDGSFPTEETSYAEGDPITWEDMSDEQKNAHALKRYILTGETNPWYDGMTEEQIEAAYEYLKNDGDPAVYGDQEGVDYQGGTDGGEGTEPEPPKTLGDLLDELAAEEEVDRDVLDGIVDMIETVKGSIPTDPESAVQTVKDILSSTILGSALEECESWTGTTTNDNGTVVPSWTKCVDVGIFGIPGLDLPLPPGMIDISVSVYDIIEKAEDIGQSFEDFINDPTGWLEDLVDKAVQKVQDIWGDITGGIDPKSTGDLLDILNGWLGNVLGGYILSQVQEATEELDPFLYAQNCKDEGFQEPYEGYCDEAGVINCGEQFNKAGGIVLNPAECGECLQEGFKDFGNGCEPVCQYDDSIPASNTEECKEPWSNPEDAPTAEECAAANKTFIPANVQNQEASKCGGCLEGYQPEGNECVEVLDPCPGNQARNELTGECEDPPPDFVKGDPCKTAEGDNGTYDADGKCIPDPTFECWDGSLAATQAECPEDTRVECWDGSLATSLEDCPEDTRVECWDGSLATSLEDCPEDTRPKEGDPCDSNGDGTEDGTYQTNANGELECVAGGTTTTTPNDGDPCEGATYTNNVGGIQQAEQGQIVNGECKPVAGSPCYNPGPGRSTVSGVINEEGVCVNGPAEVTCQDPNREVVYETGECGPRCKDGSLAPETGLCPDPTIGTDLCEDGSTPDPDKGCREDWCDDAMTIPKKEDGSCPEGPIEECVKPDGTPTGATVESGCEECPQGQDFNENGICAGPTNVICDDPSATNYGEEGECTFGTNVICDDPSATNYGEEGECTFGTDGTCDNGATNYPLCTECADGSSTDPETPCGGTVTEECSNGATDWPLCSECPDGTATSPDIPCPGPDEDDCLDCTCAEYAAANPEECGGTEEEEEEEDGDGGGGGGGMFTGSKPVQIGFDIAGDPQLLARSEFPITDYLAGLFKGIV